VRPRAANTDPAYYFYSSPDDRNQEHTSLKGGNGQGPYSWVNADLTIGKSAVVDGVGTFTLLAITPGAREYDHRFITFCFEPDPTFELAPLRYPTSDPRHDPVCGYSWVTAPECLSIRPTPTPFDTEQS